MSEIRAGEVVIAENCRRVHGREGAFDEATRRLKERYTEAMTHPCNEAADFRIVLTIVRK